MATGNQLLTLGGITKEAVRLFRNSNAFLMNIDTQYDDSFAKDGAKIGSQLKIRLPNDYLVRTGQAVNINVTSEISTTLTLGTQKGVDVSFSSGTLALSMDEFSERILAPMVNNLAGGIASDIMSGVDGGISNMTSNTTTPTANDWLNAGATLDISSAPRGDRKAILSPLTMARTVGSLTGLFNPSSVVSDQYVSGEVLGPALGIKDWLSDQTALIHVPGTAGTLTVSGAGQTGTSLVVSAGTAGTLNKGDIITIAGVYAVNRITKESTGQLAQFTVTTQQTLVAATPTTVGIYPAINPAVSGAPVQFQTVTASPASAAAITILGQANFAAGYRKNFVTRPEAVTMVTADLSLPNGVNSAARETYNDISMRMVSQYNISTDQFITRLDVLYGYLWVRPEWACIVPDII